MEDRARYFGSSIYLLPVGSSSTLGVVSTRKVPSSSVFGNLQDSTNRFARVAAVDRSSQQVNHLEAIGFGRVRSLSGTFFCQSLTARTVEVRREAMIMVL